MRKESAPFIRYAVFCLLSLSAISTLADKFEEGTDYFMLEEGVEAGKGKVIVFFSYYCPYCYEAEPVIKSLAKKTPGNLEFERVAITLGKDAGFTPTAYVSFIARDLGLENRLHDHIYSVIHAPSENEIESYGQFITMEHIEEFFLDNGVDKRDFDRAWRRAHSDSGVKKGDEKAKRYKVVATPSIIVNGKYLMYPRLEEPGPESVTVELFLYLLER